MENKSMLADVHHKLSVWLKDVKKHEITEIIELVEQAKVILRAAESIPEEKINQFIENFKYDLQEFYQQNREQAKHSIFLSLMKESFWALLSKITDKSQVEWAELVEDFNHSGDYHVGDYIGFGKLTCRQCEKSIIISHLSEVMPCLYCGHEHFKRESLTP